MTLNAANSQNQICLTANGVTKTATLVPNEATAKLISLLEKEPITISMTENGGFEKEATIEELNASGINEEIIFDLNGNIVSKRPLGKGLYVINGRKTLMK